VPRLLLLAALAASLTASPSAQVASLPPRDEGAQDPSFIAFRAKLLTAAAARDTSAVLRAFAPDATISFGGDSGPEGVRDLWLRPGIERETDFWTALVQTVSLGSVVQGDIVSAPYYFLAMPEALDPFEHVIVVGEQVRVRSEPTLSGSVLGSLTYQVVPRAPVDGVFETTADGYTWVPIRLASGERGWIADTFVRSPVGLRAGFEKRGSTWQILYFVEGD